MVQLYQRKGGEVLVNTSTAGDQTAHNIAVLADGGYVIVWTSANLGDTDSSDVKGQRFDSDGNKIGNEFLVNTAVTSFQGQPKVAALDAGRFVVTWPNLNGPSGDQPDSGIKGQVY